ncbi:MAG TPA: hypothetical protein VFU19_18295 [Iamia sp.]|nr:hypothetical protein [Iamia sp.]
MRRQLGRARRAVRSRLSPVPGLADPEVQDLNRRYSGHPASGHTLWTTERQRDGLRLPDFRSDNLYVWQRSTPDEAYAVTWAHIVAHVRPDLVGALREDGSFGAHTVTVDGRVLSRDLVDSMLELDFLATHVPGFTGPDRLRVLDVGAGYGRLAHRGTTAFPHLDWRCVDAVPISTVLCRWHLAHLGSPASVVELDHVEDEVRPGTIDLAVNVHSFNECPIDAIAWWVGLLAGRDVPWLFLVPNDTQGLTSTEADGSKHDFAPVLADAGYDLVVSRDKYADDPTAQRDGVYPEQYLLYRRR